MKKRIYSLLLMAIMIVTCFITGCSAAKHFSASRSSDASFVRLDEDPDGQYIGDFYLESFLFAKGATDVWKSNSSISGVNINAVFKNGICTVFQFETNPDNQFDFCHLTKVKVGAIKGGCPTDDTEIRSNWWRVFDITDPDDFAGNGYSGKHDIDHAYTVDPRTGFFVITESDTLLVSVPVYFVDGFKLSIEPYLKVKEDKLVGNDPFANSSKIGGRRG